MAGWKLDHLKMYFLLNMGILGIFHWHLSLLEGTVYSMLVDTSPNNRCSAHNMIEGLIFAHSFSPLEMWHREMLGRNVMDTHGHYVSHFILKWYEMVTTRKLKCHLKWDHFNRKIVFQSAFLRGYFVFGCVSNLFLESLRSEDRFSNHGSWNKKALWTDRFPRGFFNLTTSERGGIYWGRSSEEETY